MKIIQINSVCGYGSTGKIVKGIEEQILNKGYSSVIAYGRGKKIKGFNRIKIGNIFYFVSHLFKSMVFDRQGFASVRSTKKLLKQIKEYNPDIIHLHNIHGYYLNIKLLFEYISQNKKSIVWTLHDCWPYTGHCAYYDYTGCRKWTSQCFKCPEKRSYPKSFLLDNSQKNYLQKKEIFNSLDKLTIVTPSQWLANEVSESFLNKSDIVVINNGIDLNIFKEVSVSSKLKNRFLDKKVILGVASVWERRKGLDSFLKLSDLLRDDEVCVLIGLTKEQINSLPHNIIGIARTDSVNELVEFYNLADVYFNLTYEDNFPTTNLEALACGTPVVTFKTGGSIESIGDCGIIVEKGDLDAALKYFRALKKCDVDTIKNKCIERAKLLYNKSDRFDDYVKLYEKLVD